MDSNFDIYKLKIGNILINKKTKTRFRIISCINCGGFIGFKVANMTYLGMTDYINKNTINDYELE